MSDYGSQEIRARGGSDEKKQQVQKKNLTEMEKHEGWLENLRNEERTMKE